MKTDDHHRTLTPAPIPTGQFATVGQVIAEVNEHKAECAKEQAEMHANLWNAITAMRLTLEGIAAWKRSLVWVAGLVIALAGAGATIGVFVARYAIVGAITVELDKRLPPIRHAQAEPTWSPVPSAEASETRP
jgi:roadblock/LC7 domain-containing protein